MAVKPPIVELRYQPIQAAAARARVRTGCEPAQAEWTVAATVAQGQVPVLLGGRPVPAERLPFMRMHFGRGVGWIAPDQVLLVQEELDGPFKTERTFAFTGQPDEWRWRLSDEADLGEPLVIDMEALERLLDQSAPPAPATPVSREKPGRKVVYDWEHACSLAWEFRERHGYPDGVLTELVAFIADGLERRHSSRPDESKVREHLRMWMRRHPQDGETK